MRTLGLIGGMTWHSTVDYYRLINEGVQARLGGCSSASLLLLSVDFGAHRGHAGEGGLDGARPAMAEAARTLEGGRGRGLVICANTMHRLAADVDAAVRLPLIHIVDATAAAVKSAGLGTVGLLGTRYTMEMDFYRGRASRRTHGLEVLVPDEPGRDARPRRHLRRARPGDRPRGIPPGLRRGHRRPAGVAAPEGVILGCTEIPLLIKAADSPVPVFDTTALHAAAAVDFALQA